MNMKYPPRTVGLFQAAGLIVYVSLFAIIFQGIQLWLMTDDITPSPTAAIVLFLLTFIISAMICSSIMFAYPIILFLDGKKSEAIKTIFLALAWLFVFFLIFLGVILFVFVMKF